jgi:hypothetical protein
MAQYFYDGQIRRYLIQVIRLLSNFVVKRGDGTLERVPVTYGDMDRQVANILTQGSPENSLPSAPRISVYISDLEMDRNRLSDSSYVGKLHIRERDLTPDGNYGYTQGGNYTVERLMPTPYNLAFKVDIWTSSTDQKLQLMEQILMLFNPSLEIQTTDNYIDWTSLSVVDLNGVIFSSRTIPVGTATPIDVATLSLSTPIWISPPAKVKKLGVITSIITNVFTDITDKDLDYVQGLGVDVNAGTTGVSNPLPTDMIGSVGLNPTSQSVPSAPPGVTASIPSSVEVSNIPGDTSLLQSDMNGVTSHKPINQVLSSITISNFDIEVLNKNIKLVPKVSGLGITPANWFAIFDQYPGKYTPGLVKVALLQLNNTEVIGYATVNPLDNSILTVSDWDVDTYPSNDLVPGPARNETAWGSFDAIIDPTQKGPTNVVPGTRYLIIESIGGGIRETVTTNSSIQLLNTEASFKKVDDFKVFVNNFEVSATSINRDGVLFLQFDETVPAGSTIRYELFVNEDGPDAWKDVNGNDFIADANDIIEWDGEKWFVIFSAKDSADQIIYQTNLYTMKQYKWNGISWVNSFEGLYRRGTWRIEL